MRHTMLAGAARRTGLPAGCGVHRPDAGPAGHPAGGRVSLPFRILGPLEIGEAEPRLPLQARTLLGVLLLRGGEVVSAQRLADEIWGERPPASWANALQVYASRIRKVLADAGVDAELRRHGPGYVLDVLPETVDALVFERISRTALALVETEPAGADALLRDALSLWRGPVLDGLGVRVARAGRDRAAGRGAIGRVGAAARARSDARAASVRSSASSSSSSASIHSARGCAASWCWRCIGQEDRPTRSQNVGRPASSSSTSSDSSRARSFVSWSAPCFARIPRSLRRPARNPRRSAAEASSASAPPGDRGRRRDRRSRRGRS